MECPGGGGGRGADSSTVWPCGLFQVVAVLYALAMADMPQLVHVRGLGDALFYAATGAGLLGLAASWLRSRPVLNLHLMAGVLALVLAIIFTTNTKRDTTTFCNILMYPPPPPTTTHPCHDASLSYTMSIIRQQSAHRRQGVATSHEHP